MEYDQKKVDEMVLALLYLTSTSSKFGTRAWKGFDLGILLRLHQQGYISDPMDRSTSLTLSEEAAQLSAALFHQHFGLDAADSSSSAEMA